MPSDPSRQDAAPKAEPQNRIAKTMARAGLCSRREAERWIEAGRVHINGKLITSPAINVTAKDDIQVDGKPLPGAEPIRLWRYFKPRGRVTTHNDPDGRPTVFDALSGELPRVISIGRLDLNTEGLLLLTNDGGLARHLELPSTGWHRRYRVRVHGKVTQEQLNGLARGVTVDGIRYGPIEAHLDKIQGTNCWLTMSIAEGKNRELRKVLESLDLNVTRLIRVSYGPFQLGELKVGDIDEIKTRILIDQLGPKTASDLGLETPARRERRARTASGQNQRGEDRPDNGARKDNGSKDGPPKNGTRKVRPRKVRPHKPTSHQASSAKNPRKRKP